MDRIKSLEESKCKITFYKNGFSLGTFPLIEMSNEKDRMNVAIENNITDYDQYWIDYGRVKVDVRDDLRIVTNPVKRTYKVDKDGNELNVFKKLG